MTFKEVKKAAVTIYQNKLDDLSLMIFDSNITIKFWQTARLHLEGEYLAVADRKIEEAKNSIIDSQDKINEIEKRLEIIEQSKE